MSAIQSGSQVQSPFETEVWQELLQYAEALRKEASESQKSPTLKWDQSGQAMAKLVNIPPRRMVMILKLTDAYRIHGMYTVKTLSGPQSGRAIHRFQA